MEKYILRLMKHGYTGIEAYQTCVDFVRDFSLFELENYIRWVESCG